MWVGSGKCNASKYRFGIFDEEPLNPAPVPFACYLIGVDVGALCGATVQFQFLKTPLHPLPVLSVVILENTGAHQQQSFLHSVNPGIGGVGLELVF